MALPQIPSPGLVLPIPHPHTPALFALQRSYPSIPDILLTSHVNVRLPRWNIPWGQTFSRSCWRVFLCSRLAQSGDATDPAGLSE